MEPNTSTSSEKTTAKSTDQKKKTALITGITGQDGSYLTEFLLEKGYHVYGVIRRSSNFNTDRIEHIYQDPQEDNKKLTLIYGDLSDQNTISKVIKDIQPNEVYNLAAQSHVKVSFDMPLYTGDIDALGVLRLLEAIRLFSPKTRFYQASSSEMYGLVQENPQRESTPFYPRSPYGCAKVYGHWVTVNYRESYGLFACSGILFNHESPRRGGTFVTRKISRAVANIHLGRQEKLYLGNLEAKRDWGYSPDYVRAMWMMLQQEEPEDFVIATGETHTVREFTEKAFAEVGITIVWRGSGLQEKGICEKSGRVLVEIDERYFRPAEVDVLLGDASKARKILNWKPEVTFEELVQIMVREDLKAIEEGTEYRFR